MLSKFKTSYNRPIKSRETSHCWFPVQVLLQTTERRQAEAEEGEGGRGEEEGGGGETKTLRSDQHSRRGPLQSGGAHQEREGSQPLQVPLLYPPHSVTQQSIHHFAMNQLIASVLKFSSTADYQ